VRHFDDNGATKHRTDDFDGGIYPRDAGTHRNTSSFVRPATAKKMTVTTSDSWAHIL